MHGNLRNWNAGWLLAVFPKTYSKYNFGVCYIDHSQPTTDTHVRCQPCRLQGQRNSSGVTRRANIYVGVREMMSLSHLCYSIHTNYSICTRAPVRACSGWSYWHSEDPDEGLLVISAFIVNKNSLNQKIIEWLVSEVTS